MDQLEPLTDVWTDPRLVVGRYGTHWTPALWRRIEAWPRPAPQAPEAYTGESSSDGSNASTMIRGRGPAAAGPARGRTGRRHAEAALGVLCRRATRDDDRQRGHRPCRPPRRRERGEVADMIRMVVRDCDRDDCCEVEPGGHGPLGGRPTAVHQQPFLSCDHGHRRPTALRIRVRGAAPEHEDIDHTRSLADQVAEAARTLCALTTRGETAIANCMAASRRTGWQPRGSQATGGGSRSSMSPWRSRTARARPSRRP